MARRRKYLNNRDLMTEINKSKVSFCTFDDNLTDSMWDYIVDDAEQIFKTESLAVSKDAEGEEVFEDKDTILLGREARLKRLNFERLEKKLTLQDIPAQDVVFRVMTNAHIPLVPKRKAMRKIKADYEKNTLVSELFAEFDAMGKEIILADLPKLPDDVELVHKKLNFPPFFHYRLADDNSLILIGKSHWRGKNVATGSFCDTHGRVTDELGRMYMKLVQRYGTRSNWRGYTYNDEMQGEAVTQLIHAGLKFNEGKSANPFSYLTQICTNSFTGTLNNEKKIQRIRDDILEDNGLTPSWTRQTKNEDAINEVREERKKKLNDGDAVDADIEE